MAGADLIEITFNETRLTELGFERRENEDGNVEFVAEGCCVCFSPTAPYSEPMIHVKLPNGSAIMWFVRSDPSVTSTTPDERRDRMQRLMQEQKEVGHG